MNGQCTVNAGMMHHWCSSSTGNCYTLSIPPSILIISVPYFNHTHACVLSLMHIRTHAHMLPPTHWDIHMHTYTLTCTHALPYTHTSVRLASIHHLCVLLVPASCASGRSLGRLKTCQLCFRSLERPAVRAGGWCKRKIQGHSVR